MPHNLKTLIPPIDEAGRAKRIQVEHKLLDRILKDLDNPELDHAEFRGTMRDYCELKKQDNLQEKNVVHLAIADARLAAAPSRRSRLRASQGSPFGASFDSTSVTGYPDESNTDEAPHGSSDCQLSTFNFQLSPADPDIDPEWSLAPWGRRRNGKPRTEKEYRTILYRAVRDVYGLDLTESTEKHRPDRIPDPSSAGAAGLDNVNDEPSTTPSPAPPAQPAFPISTFNCQFSTLSPRSPPSSTEVSPFCRPDAPFIPKPTNPWYDF